MARANAATARRPGANAATADDAQDTAAASQEPIGVAAAAEANTVDGEIDPTAIAQPKFDPDQGWVCPAPKTGVTVGNKL